MINENSQFTTYQIVCRLHQFSSWNCIESFISMLAAMMIVKSLNNTFELWIISKQKQTIKRSRVQQSPFDLICIIDFYVQRIGVTLPFHTTTYMRLHCKQGVDSWTCKFKVCKVRLIIHKLAAGFWHPLCHLIQHLVSHFLFLVRSKSLVFLNSKIVMIFSKIAW